MITIISWKEFVSFLRTFKFYGYSLGDTSYEGAQSNVNGDEVRVSNLNTKCYVTLQVK